MSSGRRARQKSKGKSKTPERTSRVNQRDLKMRTGGFQWRRSRRERHFPSRSFARPQGRWWQRPDRGASDLVPSTRDGCCNASSVSFALLPGAANGRRCPVDRKRRALPAWDARQPTPGRTFRCHRNERLPRPGERSRNRERRGRPSHRVGAFPKANCLPSRKLRGSPGVVPRQGVRGRNFQHSARPKNPA